MKKKKIGVGSDIACSEIDGVSFANSVAVTDTTGTEVIFSLLEADNGDKSTETPLDSNFLGAEASSANGKLYKEDKD